MTTSQIQALTAELARVEIPREQDRSADLVAKLMRLGGALLPGARLDVSERLAVLHVSAVSGRGGISSAEVERYKADCVSQGYVRRLVEVA